MPTKTPGTSIMRTPLGQMRGLGAARSGTGVWWAQRLTAFALIPLTLWFVCGIIRLAGEPRAVVTHWVAQPWVAALLIALVVATFHHLQLGLQVVIEDYIHAENSRLVSLLVMKGAVLLLALLSVIAVLKMAIAPG